MVLSILAYMELAAISNDVFDVLDNWQKRPVVDMALVSYGAPCPEGYDPMSLDGTDFPGVDKGHCGCVPGYGYASTLDNCSDAAEPIPACMSYVAKSGVETKAWRGKRVCALRGGEPAESWGGEYYQRPHPDSDGVCPNGYHKCGEGLTHDVDHAICFPNEASFQCPLTNAVVAETLPAGDGWFLCGAFDDDYSLYGRREGLGEFPLVDIQLKLSTDIPQSFRDGQSYSSGDQDRGPCYIGNTQEMSTKMSVSTSNLWEMSPKYPKSCSRVDS
jgi:hypothetical protein